MADSTAQCLILTADESDVSRHLVRLLAQEGYKPIRLEPHQTPLDLLERYPWQFLVLDAGNGRPNVIDLLCQCKTTSPHIDVLVLVRRGDIETTVRAMKAGAADCIETPIDKTQFLTTLSALRGAARNHSAGIRQKLTKTEQLVLDHILDGQTSTEIAERLCRSPRTIDVHRYNIMKKLNVDGLVGLVRQSLREESNV